MPCLHCRGSMLGLLQHSALHGIGPKEDVRLAEATPLSASFAAFFEPARICRLCGVVFYPPKETARESAAEGETLVPRLDGGLFPASSYPSYGLVGGMPVPASSLPPPPSTAPFPTAPSFRPEKLVIPTDSTDEMLDALRAAGFSIPPAPWDVPLEDEATVESDAETPLQCENRDGMGVQCELRAGHSEPCACPEALARFREGRK